MGKKQKPEGKKYNYMDTYGDLVTLLLCFFVLLFSMSTVEEGRFNVFVEALSAHFGSNMELFSNATSESPNSGVSDSPTDTGNTTEEEMPMDLNQLVAAIEQFIGESSDSAALQSGVTVEQGESGATFIRLSNDLLFEGNSSTLRPGTKEFLDFLGESMVATQDQILQVQFNGHTASVPGSSVDDWELASARAGKVASYFTNTVGFDRYKIKTSSYGRNFPIADNATPEGMAKNRRVDIVILSNDPDKIELTLMDAMRVYFPGDTTDYFEGNQGALPDDMIDNVTPTIDGKQLENLTEEQWKQIQAILNAPQTQAASPATAQEPASEAASGDQAASNTG